MEYHRAWFRACTWNSITNFMLSCDRKRRPDIWERNRARQLWVVIIPNHFRLWFRNFTMTATTFEMIHWLVQLCDPPSQFPQKNALNIQSHQPVTQSQDLLRRIHMTSFDVHRGIYSVNVLPSSFTIIAFLSNKKMICLNRAHTFCNAHFGDFLRILVFPSCIFLCDIIELA